MGAIGQCNVPAVEGNKHFQWIGLREHLQESTIFNGKICVCFVDFHLNQSINTYLLWDITRKNVPDLWIIKRNTNHLLWTTLLYLLVKNHAGVSFSAACVPGQAHSYITYTPSWSLYRLAQACIPIMHQWLGTGIPTRQWTKGHYPHIPILLSSI